MGWVDIRRDAARAVTRTAWLSSRHSFSFGVHYDPGNTHFGPLVAHNDDVLLPGEGFAVHPHRDLEIITWVIEGQLRHEDSTGRVELVSPGMAQRLNAGSGVRHSEVADGDARVRLVQAWLTPDRVAGEPTYQRSDDLMGSASGLVVVAVGSPGRQPTGAVSLGVRGAVLRVARLAAGQSVELPAAAATHLYVARGAVTFDRTTALYEGDAVRMAAAGGTIIATSPAEVLAWELPGAD